MNMQAHRTTPVVALVAVLAGAACSKPSPPAAEPVPPSAAEQEGTADPPSAAEPAAGDPTEAKAHGSSIVGEEIDYKVGDETLKGYLAYDANQKGPRPGVLVVHEWWGLNDYARMRARMLAELGYTALAVDMYGDGKTATHPDDAGKFAGQVRAHMDVAKKRFDAARELLRAQPTTDPERIAAIGYCFGGGIVLQMARTGMDLDAVASFHGTLATDTPAKKGAIQGKVMVFHGADDPFVPPAQVEAFKKEMAAADVDLEFVDYPGAKHAFTNPEATALGEKFGLPLAYQKKADEDSWKRMQEGFAEVFGSGAN